jgi:Flp pilus assembly pilin Flp
MGVADVVQEAPLTRHGRRTMNRREVIIGLVRKLLHDETGVTTLEYVVAGVALALAAVAASRMIAGVLKDYLHRIYLIVTLPIP